MRIDKKQAISIADKLADFCFHMDCAECPFAIPDSGFFPECMLIDELPQEWDVDQAWENLQKGDLSKSPLFDKKLVK